MSHLFELYFKEVEGGAFFQKRIIEGILKTCIHYGPIACKAPDNYEARSNLMWASSWAINGFFEIRVCRGMELSSDGASAERLL